jgi:hypothetical protein
MTLELNFSERSRPPESNSSMKTAEGLGFDFEGRVSGNRHFAYRISAALLRLPHQLVVGVRR